jgi:uncharacterized protein DUF4124
MKTLRWPLLLALLATAAASADVYRSTDAKGTVVYSDRPSDVNAEPMVVTTPKPGRPGNAIAPKAADAQANAANGQNAPGDKTQGAQKGAKKEPTAAEQEDKAKNCQAARERKQKYDMSHRLFRTGANGDREYLNDAEIDEARARAAADVQTWCGG